MKKLISLVLALMLVFSMATVASAAEESATVKNVDYGTITPDPMTITGGKTFSYTPGEGRKWNVTGNVTYGEYTATLDGVDIDKDITATMAKVEGATTGNIVITFPELNAAGRYEFTFKEVSTDIQGVTISEETFKVAVIVGYSNTENSNSLTVIKTAAWIVGTDDNKVTTMTNGFEAGSFTVAKDVTGDLANENDKFNIKVTLTAEDDMVIGTPIYVKGEAVTVNSNTWSTTLNISENDGEILFDQIPAGVTVTIAELDNSGNPISTVNTEVKATNDQTNNGNYKYQSTSAPEITVKNGSSDACVVTNSRTANVTTGIVTDSAPYIILIAVCAVAAVAFVLKRRNAVEF